MGAPELIALHTGTPMVRGRRRVHRLRHLLIGPPTPLDRVKARLAQVGDWLIRHTVEWEPAFYRDTFYRASA